MKFSIGNQEEMGLSIHKNKPLPRSSQSAAQAVTCTIECFQQSLLAETAQEEIMPNGNADNRVLPAPDRENTLLDAGPPQLNAETGPPRHTTKNQFIKPGFIDARYRRLEN
jgi:hypothetical protein